MAKRTRSRRSTKSKIIKTGGLAFSHGIRVRSKRAKASSAGYGTANQRARPPSHAQHTSASPFPGFPRPTMKDVSDLHKVLARHFRERRKSSTRKAKRPILDTVVGTILSQNTTNTNSARAFANLKKECGNWNSVRLAKPSRVASSIKCGGLAPTKTKWIQHILKTIHKERGKTSMEYLRKQTKEEVHSELERFTGVGKKTSAIINLFDVGHPDMAVDTHVFRYACQLGWAPTDKERAIHNKSASRAGHWPKVTRDTVYAHLDATFPDHLKYSMHLILTDTVGGLPVVCTAQNTLSFDGKAIQIDGKPY